MRLFPRGAPFSSQLHALAEAHPDRVRVERIGRSVEGRDLHVVRVTDFSAPADEVAARPRAVFLGGVHPRERYNPPSLLSFGWELANGFGKDAELTGLLRSRQLTMVPLVSPDGHARLEGVDLSRFHRMERDPDQLWQIPGRVNARGVNLNRNFATRNFGTGDSPELGHFNYGGEGPASEPETQAVQELVRSEGPGLLTDWHSYGNEVIESRDFNRQPGPFTPEEKGSQALAQQLAVRNRHARGVFQTRAYDFSGTSTGWGYEQGIPSVAVETGDRFFPTPEEAAAWEATNRPARIYGLKIADDPCARVAGPALERVALEGRTLRAWADRPVQALEVVTDPAAPPGTGAPLVPMDAGDARRLQVVLGDLDALGLTKDLLYVRAQGPRGGWGPATAAWHPDARP